MLVFGHRGNPGFPRYAENTLTSFRSAIDAGADGIELDVRRCGDGQIVVIHDATVERTTNGAGRVGSLTYEQLGRFDAGRGDHIPRLVDILHDLGRTTTINIELKEAGLAAEVAEMVLAQDLRDHVIVSAFDSDDNEEYATSNWLELSRISCAVSIALLATRRKVDRISPTQFAAAARELGAHAIHPSRDAATARLVTIAHTAGLKVRTWTVNSVDSIPHWRALGIDAIFTDLPGDCIQVNRNASA